MPVERDLARHPLIWTAAVSIVVRTESLFHERHCRTCPNQTGAELQVPVTGDPK